ncbi:MAG: hypothetical protein ACI4K9_01550 [Candidatus Fimenecus sp.]
MDKTDALLKQAVRAFSPSATVRERVKFRICPHRFSGVSVVFVHKDGAKIMESVFKRYEKLMNKTVK